MVKGAFPEYGLDQLIHLYTLAGFSSEEFTVISSLILDLHRNDEKVNLRRLLLLIFFVFLVLFCSLFVTLVLLSLSLLLQFLAQTRFLTFLLSTCTMDSSWSSNCREIHYHLARAIMRLNIFEYHSLNQGWTGRSMMLIHIGDRNRIVSQSHTIPILPATSILSCLFRHQRHIQLMRHMGGLPSHMIVNPKPDFRPVSTRPLDRSHPSNTVRSRSCRGESSNPVNLPLHSTTISVPTDPGSDNPSPNLEPRPKKKQRVHVTVSETHGETITALRLTPLPLMLQHRMSLTADTEAVHPTQNETLTYCGFQFYSISFGTPTSISSPSPERPHGEEPSRESVNEPALPPPSTINPGLRPWSGMEGNDQLQERFQSPPSMEDHRTTTQAHS